MSLYLPPQYRNLLGSVEQTEKAIKAVKDMFQDNLSAQLALLRVTAPMTSAPSAFRSGAWTSSRPRSCTPWPNGSA